MKINRWLIETFGFSKTEIRGIWVVFTLILLLAILPRIYFKSQRQNLKTEQSKKDKEALALWAKEMNERIGIKEKKKKSLWVNYEKSTYVKRPFKKESKTHFTKASDKSADYYSVPSYNKLAEPTEININQASEELLQTINGIGPTLSKRIIKYRDLVGGFHDTLQFYEVYGLPIEVVEKLSKVAALSDSLSRININTDSLKHLYKHPYIDYRLAKMIVNYRHVHGDYQQPTDLLLLKTMSDSIYQKLYPYISTSSSD